MIKTTYELNLYSMTDISIHAILDVIMKHLKTVELSTGAQLKKKEVVFKSE